MKKILLIIGVSFTLNQSFGQFLTDFETPDFGVVDSAWFGQDQVTDGDTVYVEGGQTFELNYNSTWQSFTGFAVSSWTDNLTPGWANQYSAMPGEGANNSDQYAVCYVSQWSNNRVWTNAEPGKVFQSIDVTNTAYAYYSMLNGDAFAKPFGADTAANGQIDGTNGEDWFMLTIYPIGTDSLHTGDSLNFNLADYTFADNSQDYIIDEWTTIDLLSNLPQDQGNVIGLDFVLSSSDTTGGFGMNTPAYFALDNVTTAITFGFDEEEQLEFTTFPNPFSNELTIQLEAGSTVMLSDLSGRMIRNEVSFSNQLLWNLSDLESGIYMITVERDGRIGSQKIIKQ